MKIETEARDDHQMKIVAEFEATDLDRYKHQAARKIAQKAKVPGFRPGKAPYDVILRLYGDAMVEEEAIEIMVEKVYPEILDEAKIQPSAPGSLENLDKGDPIKFTFVVPLEPTVDLGDYLSIRKKYNLKSVTDKQVDEFITRLQKNYATAEPVDHPAQDGDLVYLNLDAILVDPTGDDKPELLKDSPLQVIIGENDPEQNTFPYLGFGDNLKGLAAEEEKNFKYIYPKDSSFEKLRGRNVEFHVTIQSIKKLVLPALNDEFAQSMGEFENFDKLKESIKAQLDERQRVEYEQTYFDELLDKLVESAKVNYPPQMIEHEMEHVVESVTDDLTRQRMELDAYLKTLKKEKDVWMEEDVKPAAKKRLERSLVLDELSKVEKIEVKNEDLQAEFTGMISEMQNTTDAKKLEKQLRSEKVANALAMQAATRVLNRNVLNRLKDIATGKAVDKSVEDAAVPEISTDKIPAAKKSVKETKAASEKAKTGTEKPKKPAPKKKGQADEKPVKEKVKESK